MTVDAARRLLAAVGPGLFQQGIVVADIVAAQIALGAVMGCDRWVTLPPADLDYDLRGRTVSCALDLAFGRSGGVQVELLQPVRGEGLHVEFLAAHGPGLHHLGFRVDDLADVAGEARTLGFPPVMGGGFGPLRFCYLDTWDALGVYVELVEDPEGTMAAIMPWR